MKRVVLTDGSGRWLDIENAERYDEAVRFNGSEFVSLATNRLYFHEELYKISNGVWLKHWWDSSKISADRWETISKEEAAKWFSINNYEEPPEELKEEYEKLRLA